MNQTQKLAYQYLTQKLNKTNIRYQRGIPTFIDTETSTSYEPKRLYGQSIWFYENQFTALQKENCSIIVIHNSPDPVAVFPIDILEPNKVFDNILIRVVPSLTKVPITQQVITQLKEIGKEEFKCDVPLTQTIQFLVNYYRSNPK